jgi:hypothetical protein
LSASSMATCYTGTGGIIADRGFQIRVSLRIRGRSFFKARQICIPGQQGLELLNGIGSADTLQNMQQVGSRLEIVGLGRLDQRVHRRAGMGAAGGVGEEPGLAAYCKGSDRVLRQRIADVQMTIVAIAGQELPLVDGVVDGLARQ